MISKVTISYIDTFVKCLFHLVFEANTGARNPCRAAYVSNATHTALLWVRTAVSVSSGSSFPSELQSSARY
jgi:hypothetical protein